MNKIREGKSFVIHENTKRCYKLPLTIALSEASTVIFADVMDRIR